MRQLDNNRYVAVIQKFNEKYTAEMVLDHFNLLKDATDLNEQFSLCCPFHDDLLPSFRIEKSTGKWHCFGCGVGGHLMKLMYMLDNRSIPLSVYVDNYLKQDEILQRELGFRTVFLDGGHMPIEDFLTERKKRKFKADHSFQMPISTLAYELKKQDASFVQLSSSLELLQNGLSPNEVYRVITNVNANLQEKEEENILLRDMLL